MRSRWRGGIPAGMLLLWCGAGASCSPRQEPAIVTQSWMAMGTFASVSVPRGEQVRLAEAGRVAEARMAADESRLSVFRADSDVSRLNAAGGQTAVVSPETVDMVSSALHYAELSDGAFDPTVDPLMQLWGFRGETAPALPSEDALREVLRRVGFRGVTAGGGEARLSVEGMRLDLGGIAKGYAVDRCLDVLAGAGFSNVLVNLGGNIRCLGRPQEGRNWTVAVRNPFDRERVLGRLSLASGWALATSGNYERFVTIEGERHAHIVDPRTGRPVRGMAGVTVLSESATEADAMSTALFVLGIDGSREVRKRLPGCQVLFVPDTEPRQLRATPGFRRFFTPDPEWAAMVVDLDE